MTGSLAICDDDDDDPQASPIIKLTLPIATAAVHRPMRMRLYRHKQTLGNYKYNDVCSWALCILFQFCDYLQKPHIQLRISGLCLRI